MDLQTFNGLVDDSSARDWERVASDGTTYTDAFHPSMSGGSDTINLDVNSHYAKAVLKQDIDITVAWGRDPHSAGSFDRGGRDLSFAWQENFADPKVHAVEVDLFYRGSLVRREWLLAVDGGRGYIPFGRTKRRGGAEPMSRNAEDYYDTCTAADVKFARLMDGIANHHSDFDIHMQQAGYVVED